MPAGLFCAIAVFTRLTQRANRPNCAGYSSHRNAKCQAAIFTACLIVPIFIGRIKLNKR